MQRFNKIRFAIYFAALVILISGCSQLGIGSGSQSASIDVCSAAQAISYEQMALVTAARAAIALSRMGRLNSDAMQKAQASYRAWRDTQLLLLAALQQINDAGGKPTALSAQQYAQLGAQALLSAADFIAVYNSFSQKNTAMTALGKRAALAEGGANQPPSACVISDADLATRLTPPDWDSL